MVSKCGRVHGNERLVVVRQVSSSISEQVFEKQMSQLCRPKMRMDIHNRTLSAGEKALLHVNDNNLSTVLMI
jgi:hypothetical protein